MGDCAYEHRMESHAGHRDKIKETLVGNGFCIVEHGLCSYFLQNSKLGIRHKKHNI